MRDFDKLIGFDVDYLINKDGEVKSLDRKIKNSIGNGYRLIKGKTMKKSIGSHGYYTVSLKKDGKWKTELLHRLLANTYLPNPDNKPCINHINGIKTDNSLENLEWATYSENSQHAFKNGLNNNFGENCHKSKLSKKQVKEIFRLLDTDIPQREIASKFNVNETTISSLKHKTSWKRVIGLI